MRPRELAFWPNWPKLTSAPDCERPRLRPLRCLRNLVLFGCYMTAYPLISRGLVGTGFRSLGSLLEHFAFEDPSLDTDHAGRRVRLGKAIIDVGTQRMHRHAPFAKPLGARKHNTAKTTTDVDLDALCAQAHGAGHGTLHRAAEHD